MNKIHLYILLICFTFSLLKAQKNFSAYGFELTGGYCQFSNSDINEILQRLDRDLIDHGISLGSAFYFPVFNNFSLFLGAGYLTGNSKREAVVTGEDSPEPIANIEDEYKISTIPIRIGSGFYHPFRSLFWRINLAAEYHFIKMTYKFPAVNALNLPEYSDELSDTGFGFLISTGLIWPVHSRFSILGDIGYRYLKMSGFSSEEHFFPFNFSLDLSGLLLEAGVFFNL